MSTGWLDQYDREGHDESLPGAWLDVLEALYTPGPVPDPHQPDGLGLPRAHGARQHDLQLRGIPDRRCTALGVPDRLPDGVAGQGAPRPVVR